MKTKAFGISNIDNVEDSTIYEEAKDVGDDSEWIEGYECMARWEEDGCWYVAVVDGVEGDTAAVTFTEFGISAKCSVENLRVKSTKIVDDGQLEEEDDGDWE